MLFWQRMLQVPAAHSGNTPSYRPYTAHSHEQAWVALMAAELDKTICLVCSVNAIIGFERHHQLSGPSSHIYCLLGAAGLPGQQEKLNYLHQ